MMNLLFAVTDYTQKNLPFGDALAFGGQMLLLGLGTVFSVLIILWVALILFKVFFHDIPNRRTAKAPVVETVPETVEEVVETDDTELIAVLAAAIAAAESEASGAKFRVVSFKRK